MKSLLEIFIILRFFCSKYLIDILWGFLILLSDFLNVKYYFIYNIGDICKI